MDKIPPRKSGHWLVRLSVQNMLALVSVNLMVFIDRIILAKHSLASLNAVVTAGAVCNIFIFGAIALIGIADVFIAQSYGAGDERKIGPILWQMIWLSLAVSLLFAAIGHVCSSLLFHQSMGALPETYFRWQMSLAFLPILVATLTSFFIGTKRFGFALITVLIVSLFKLALEIPLVFGIDGLFLGLGIKGTLLATAISQGVHVTILASVIMTRENQKRFSSLALHLNPKLLFECCRLGLPQSLGSMLNYSAWCIVVSLLAIAGHKHLMMYTIVDSMYALFGFMTEGLQKSVLSLSANLIGSGRFIDVPKVFRQALFLLIPVTAILAIPLLFLPGFVTQGLHIGILSKQEVSLACLVIWIYFIFDGIGWILSGLLTAMGDTLFVNPVNALASFIGAGVTYGMTTFFSSNAEITCWHNVIYGAINCILLITLYTYRHRFIKPLPLVLDKNTVTHEQKTLTPLLHSVASGGS